MCTALINIGGVKKAHNAVIEYEGLTPMISWDTCV